MLIWKRQNLLVLDLYKVLMCCFPRKNMHYISYMWL
uniref:Uncharacterized protein n=1 Tax=Arundo donax TaxID=35708 RepID=A0A0A9ADT7_ARUDO